MRRGVSWGSGFGALIVLAFVLAADVAWSQTPACPSGDEDVFRVARRSRRVAADAAALLAANRDDLARNARLYHLQTGEEMPWSFGLAGLVERTQTYGYDVCTSLGPWTGDLVPLRLGAIASFELPRVGVGVEAFVMLVQDRLTVTPTEAQTRTPDGGFREPTGLATLYVDDVMYGGRVTLFDWASVVGGWIETKDVRNVVGEDGREITVGPLGERASGRLYLGAGIPRYSVFTHVLFEERDVAAEQLEVNFERIPVPGVDFLVGTAGVGWIDDESQVFVELGAREIFGILSAEVSFEHRPVALRHARLRADWDTFFGREPTARVERPELAEPRMGIDLGAFAELSWFGSRWLEEQTGRGGAVGGSFGVFARPDITILMTKLELLFGVNGPEELAAFSQAAGHWHVGFRLHGRLGL
ncbi:hypothetical protein L6R52_18045 [Myxococcota bacterium]|nr:hypothetical protein [Myxococcota bacterium]